METTNTEVHSDSKPERPAVSLTVDNNDVAAVMVKAHVLSFTRPSRERKA